MLRRRALIVSLGISFGIFAPWSALWAAPAPNLPAKTDKLRPAMAQRALDAANQASINPFSPLQNRRFRPIQRMHQEQLPPPPALGSPLPLAKGTTANAPVLVGYINGKPILKTSSGFVLKESNDHAK